MKKRLFPLLICILFTSCDNNKKYAEQAVIDFLSYAKYRDEDGMVKVFPKISDIGYYPIFDSYEITEIKNQLGYYDVHVSAYRGGSPKKYYFFVYPSEDKSDKSYYISESIGIIDVYSHELYDFAKKTGCITDNCYFDSDIAKRFSAAKLILFLKSQEIRHELHNVYVPDYNWTRVGSGAFIKGIAKNGSRYNLDHVKYRAIFQDYDGNEICTDNGTLFYDTFRSNSSRSFSVHSSYIGGAKRVYFSIEFDDDFIEKEALKMPCTGKEYDEYLERISKE